MKVLAIGLLFFSAFMVMVIAGVSDIIILTYLHTLLLVVIFVPVFVVAVIFAIYPIAAIYWLKHKRGRG